MTNLDSIFKSRDITLSTKVRLVKAMVFPPSCELFWVRLGLNLLSSPVPGRLLTHQRLLSSKAIQLLAQGLALILTFITVVGWPRGRPL